MRQLLGTLLPDPILLRLGDLYWRAAATYRKANPARVDYGDAPVLKCVVAYNEHGGYCVPLSSRHRPATQRILAGSVWEQETLRFLTERCGDGDIVHAGTYFGDFLPALSRACSDNAMVWAFEPNPESHRCATMTTQINGLQNVRLTHAGLGAQRGSVLMEVSDAKGRALGGASRIAQGNRAGSATTTTRVDIVSIDEAVPRERNVTIIQLDVEDYEQEALAGALETIRRCRPLLVLENLPSEAWFSEHLRPLGYRQTAKICDNVVLSCAEQGQ